jgi:hypothetical protein
MLRLETKSKLSPEEAIKKAISYFGPKGYGLTIKEQGPTYAKFEGAGGTVEVTSCAEKKGSSLEVLSTEWDVQAKEFLTKI